MQREEPLTEAELAIALHPEVVAAEHRGYDRGFAEGMILGARIAKAECQLDHATIEARCDLAARKFYALQADEAHNKALAKSAAAWVDVERARSAELKAGRR